MKTTKCPCGQVITVPPATADQISQGFASAHGYDVASIVCPKCNRHVTSGNTHTGEISGWMTQKAINRANADYRQQCFESDNNEFYGRGNW